MLFFRFAIVYLLYIVLSGKIWPCLVDNSFECLFLNTSNLKVRYHICFNLHFSPLPRITAPTFNLMRFIKGSFKLSPGYIFGIEIFRTLFEMSPRSIKKKYTRMIPCYCLIIVQIKWVVFVLLIVNMTLVNFSFFYWRLKHSSSIFHYFFPRC